MSRIISKLDELNKLRFESLTACPVNVSKVVLIDGSTVVALGVDGVIYTNSSFLRSGIARPDTYSPRLYRVVDGCVKLGALTKKATEQHKQNVIAEEKARKLQRSAKWLLELTEEVGLKLTATQSAKLKSVAEAAA